MNLFTKILGFLFIITAVPYSAAQSFRPPEPKMSNNVLKDFIQMHIEYPLQSFENKEEGTVIISFKVNEKGLVKDATVKQSVSKSIDSAALHLFSLIIWDPATEYGLPVSSESEFKIKYSTSKYNTYCKKRGYDAIDYPVKPIDFSGTIYTISQLEKAPEARIDSNYRDIHEFITHSLEYPEEAKKFSLSGVVKLKFVIETNGLPSNILIVEPVGGGCTEEAIRIVEKIRWLPGIKSGGAVRTCYELSIRFDPADELRNKSIPNQSNPGI